MKPRLLLALLAIAPAACGQPRLEIPDTAVIVRNGTIIDGTGGPPLTDGVIVIQGSRIRAVGPAREFDIPETATVVDARGGTILPGVIDSHTHSTHEASERRGFLVDGVTTVCNLGTSLDRLPLFGEGAVESGPAARAYWAGPIITAPGGYPGPVYGTQFNYEVGSPEEGRAAVVDLLNRGASMIKIALAPGDPRNPWPVLDLATVQAITETAHSRGAPVRAHVFEPFLVEDIVLPAGVDVIEHQPFPILTPEEEDRVLSSDHPGPLLFDTVAPDYLRLMARVVEAGIMMVPTLDQRVGPLFNRTDRSHLEQLVLDLHLEAARRFHSLGGVYALGTDFGGVPHVQPGMPITEMRLLQAAGLTPMEVLVAGTRNAARACGQEAGLGSLEAGKLADIIVVEGDPLADLGALEEIRAVIKGGVLAFPSRPAR